MASSNWQVSLPNSGGPTKKQGHDPNISKVRGFFKVLGCFAADNDVKNMSKLWRKEILNLVQTDLRAKSVTFPPKSLTNSVNYFIFLGQAPLPVVLGAAGA